MTRYLSHLIFSEDSVLAVQKVKTKSFFGIYLFGNNIVPYKKEIPRPLANAWSYSAKDNAIACIGWDNNVVSLFQAQNGSELLRFSLPKPTNPEDRDQILIFNQCLRVCRTSIKRFNFSGHIIGEKEFSGDFICDLGRYIIVEQQGAYSLLDEYGNGLGVFPKRGVGITSGTVTSTGLVISEGRGPISMITEGGQIVWSKTSPLNCHPTQVGCDKNGLIHAVHRNLLVDNEFVLTVHDSYGGLLHQEELHVVPSVGTFCPTLPGWISEKLETFSFQPNGFVRGSLEVIREAFSLLPGH